MEILDRLLLGLEIVVVKPFEVQMGPIPRVGPGLMELVLDSFGSGYPLEFGRDGLSFVATCLSVHVADESWLFALVGAYVAHGWILEEDHPEVWIVVVVCFVCPHFVGCVR
jgi:hypothetical protein